MQIVAAHTTDRRATVRAIFTEYAHATGIDFCFQNFDRELADLPGKYAPPTGRLFLALESKSAAGCVALRKLEAGVCEMKRLYVRPAFRGNGFGRRLANEIIFAAREMGYDRMRLDTLASMTPAIALYESLGFQRIPAYYDNPNESAVYLELKLHG